MNLRSRLSSVEIPVIKISTFNLSGDSGLPETSVARPKRRLKMMSGLTLSCFSLIMATGIVLKVTNGSQCKNLDGAHT